MLNALNHGWLSLCSAYALAACGLFLGFRWARVSTIPVAWILAASAPVALGAGIALPVLRLFLPALPWRLSWNVHILLGMGFIVVVGVLVGRVRARARPHEFLRRGTRILDTKSASRRTTTAGGTLTIAGQPVPSDDETKHFKLIGTTGTGKSTAIRELLDGALARGDRAVIADPGGAYAAKYFDAARGDVLLNPFDARSARWDLFAEIRLPHDADQLARSLIPDYEGSDRNWRHYARTFVTGVLRQLHRAQEHDLARLYWLLLLAPADELRELLEATPAGAFLGQDNGRFFESVRSVTAVHIAAIEHVARRETGDRWSVRRWVQEGKGVLFLPYRATEVASLRQIISCWMRLAIFQALDGPESDQRLWFVVDELDALGAIDGLKDALARLRKFGGRGVIGLQSIAQVRGTYGDAEAQTIIENCGNTLILRCSASERGGTAEFASRLIGQREIIRRQTSRSGPFRLFGGLDAVHTTSHHHTMEDAVLPSEIEQLPDLTGFLKLASRPEWTRVRYS